MAECLSAIKHTDLNYLRVMMTIANHFSAIPGVSIADIKKLFPSEFYNNYGTKSKNVRGPYTQDVSKKKMFDEAFDSIEFNAQTRVVMDEMYSFILRDIKDATIDDKLHDYQC